MWGRRAAGSGSPSNAAGAAGSVSVCAADGHAAGVQRECGHGGDSFAEHRRGERGAVFGADVVLAGTGDPNDASDSYYGEGILRSADGGVTWTLVQGTNDGVAGNHSFVGLGWRDLRGVRRRRGWWWRRFLQAAEGSLVNAPDATYSVMGLYYSTDAGVTWQMATIDGWEPGGAAAVGGGAPGNAATAVVWNAVRQRFYAAVRYHGYYESADGSDMDAAGDVSRGRG